MIRTRLWLEAGPDLWTWPVLDGSHLSVLPEPRPLFVRQLRLLSQIPGGNDEKVRESHNRCCLGAGLRFGELCLGPLALGYGSQTSARRRPLQITYAVTNPLSTPLSLNVQHSITGPCVSESGSQTLSMASAGQVGSTQTNTFTYTLPSTNCAGTYTIKISVTYDGNQVASVSRTVPVN